MEQVIVKLIVQQSIIKMMKSILVNLVIPLANSAREDMLKIAQLANKLGLFSNSYI